MAERAAAPPKLPVRILRAVLGFRGDGWWIALMVLGFAAVRYQAWKHGLRFDTNAFWYWHVLDEDLLRNDLLRSLYALHAQPPLYNLFYGLALKVIPDAHFPLVVANTYRLVSLAGMLGAYGLLRELGMRPLAAAPLALLVFSTPVVLAYESNFFYTAPIAVMVVLSAWALARACVRKSRGALYAFAFFVVALAFTRATFHPAWVVLAFLPVLLVRELRRPALASGAVAALLVGALCLKNGLLIGSWGTSSWLGMNLARMTTDRIPVEEKRKWAKTGGFDPVCVRGSFGLARQYPKAHIVIRGPDLPALRRERKSEGSVNHNHAASADASKHFRACALRVVQERPEVYRKSLREAFVLFVKPPTDWFLVVGHAKAMGKYTKWYARWALGARKTGISFAFFAELTIVLVALVVAFVRRRRHPTAAAHLPVLLFSAGTIVFISLVAVFAELGENMRFRAEIEPLVQLLAFSSLGALIMAAFRPRKAPST